MISFSPPDTGTVLVIFPILTVTLPFASSGTVTLTIAGSPSVMFLTVALTSAEATLVTITLAELFVVPKYLSFSR